VKKTQLHNFPNLVKTSIKIVYTGHPMYTGYLLSKSMEYVQSMLMVPFLARIRYTPCLYLRTVRTFKKSFSLFALGHSSMLDDSAFDCISFELQILGGGNCGK
jgi:hypothetical protein